MGTVQYYAHPDMFCTRAMKQTDGRMRLMEDVPSIRDLRACLSVRFQGFTPTPQYRPSASSRLWPARPAALCLPDPCGLGSDNHGGKDFSGKLLEFLIQTGSKGEGFDVKVLKEIIKLRKQDKDERDEHETLLDVYMRAMESTSPAPVAEAA